MQVRVLSRVPPMSIIKIAIIASVPADIAQQFMQHMRDFDTAHEGCHFTIRADAPGLRVEEIERILDVEPPFPVRHTLRKQ